MTHHPLTFLFTDLENSTHLWEQFPQVMRPALARHDALLRAAVEHHHGKIVKTTGDGLHAVFESPSDGVAAALAGQQTLIAEPWPTETSPLRVRMDLHTGESQEREGDYYGPALNRAARIMSTGYGGQVLLSNVTAALVQDSLPTDTSLLDLGEHCRATWPYRNISSNSTILPWPPTSLRSNPSPRSSIISRSNSPALSGGSAN